MSVPLKKCTHPGCENEFPEHSLSDVCGAHSSDRESTPAPSELEKLLSAGPFAVLADEVLITDLDGNPVDRIVAGQTIIHGPWRAATKDQIARVTGVVTESMCNGTDDSGQPIYQFQGNGWTPQANIGDVLLQDVSNADDRWSCAPALFGGSNWNGTVAEDLSVTYAKPGKPTLVLAIPEGTIVVSLEGDRPFTADALLAIGKPQKGDVYVWTPDVVEKYVNFLNSTS